MSKNVICLVVSTALVALVALASPAEAGSCSGSSSKMSTANAHEAPNIVETAISAGSFQTLVAAVQAAGLAEVLADEGPFTVFAPTDEAFAALPEGTVEELLKPENRDQLVAILKYHVVSGKVFSDQALELGSAQTLQSQSISIAIEDGQAKVNEATLVQTDLEASNGVIHVVDQVLLPPTRSEKQARAARNVIFMAINRGAPMYNHGNQAACAAVYAMAAECLIAMESLTPEEKRVLQTAMRRADQSHSSDRQAWIMRDALDAVYASVEGMDLASR
jgi:uncharacterized surface protein with fasciclin (FAS1) repeats